ncbi:MAG: phosphoheptose isomerase, partial [Legionellales bacterium]
MTNPLIKNNLNLVQQHLQNSIDTKKLVIEQCAPQIAEAGNAIVSCLKAGNKILACGNGGSAADAQHFAAELLGRFEKERIELPAIALTTDSSIITAIGNDYGYEVIFSKQVAGLGQAGDILLA